MNKINIGDYVSIGYTQDNRILEWVNEQEQKGVFRYKITMIDSENEYFKVENCPYEIWFIDEFYVVNLEKYEQIVPTEKAMKCNMCDGHLKLYNYNGTYIWICQDCMNIQFEYETERDLDNLVEFIKGGKE